jgi:hypothetical protein
MQPHYPSRHRHRRHVMSGWRQTVLAFLAEKERRSGQGAVRDGSLLVPLGP